MTLGLAAGDLRFVTGRTTWLSRLTLYAWYGTFGGGELMFRVVKNERGTWRAKEKETRL